MAIEMAKALHEPQLVTAVHTEGAATVLTMRGEADARTLGIVVDSLARTSAEHDGPLVVDLQELTFIDSRTLVAFERARAILERRGRTLWLRSPSPLAGDMLQLFELTHLLEPAPPTTTHARSGRGSPGHGRVKPAQNPADVRRRA